MPYLFPSGLQALRSFWKIFTRRLLRTLLFFRSEEDKLKAERKLRGRQQYRLLQQADIVLVSFGKSGRTWLRVMLSRVYQQIYGLPEHAMIGFDNFHYMNRAIPRMFFTHDTYIGDYTGHRDNRQDYYDKKVVMLARDPRDVAVSQYFQWKYRMKEHKRTINKYPRGDEDVSIFDFLMKSDAGLIWVIDFLNVWAREADKMQDFFLLRYEDMKSQPRETLEKLTAFMGTPASEADIDDAVRYSSYENMKKMEAKNTFWLSGGRMAPKDRSNPDSFKVRRAKVGGFRDYFDDEQVEQIERMVSEKLLPFYGYTREERAAKEKAGMNDT
ncbi:MAG TPA: sulfotransferase [Gammaproteobacteria bacterium]|nr:sulfotransferase [Gammaproteobacteria bacterium]